MIGEIPPSIDGLAELAGQVYDPGDQVAVRYRTMLAAKLDPVGTTEKVAFDKEVRTKVQGSTRIAMKNIGVI